MSQPTGTPNANVDTSKTAADPNAGSVTDDVNPDGTGTDTDALEKAKGEDGLKSALQKERVRANQAEKKLRDAELAKLPELERYKTQAEELTKENEKLTVENQRMKIGMELGLKWSIAKRISGDTEEEMRKDAADLVGSMRNEDGEDSPANGGKSTKDKDAVNKATTVNDGKAKGPAGKSSMSDLIRAAAGRNAH